MSYKSFIQEESKAECQTDINAFELIKSKVARISTRNLICELVK